MVTYTYSSVKSIFNINMAFMPSFTTMNFIVLSITISSISIGVNAFGGGGVPDKWNCPDSWYSAFYDSFCDCGCGTYDPDCNEQGAVSYGCSGIYECNQNSYPSGTCVLSSVWTCDPENYDSNDGCHCNCGAYDPDCDKPGNKLENCGTNEFCNTTGHCESSFPKWTCDISKYADNHTCDCLCGIYDPDCVQNDISSDCPQGLRCGFEDLDASFCGIFIDKYIPSTATNFSGSKGLNDEKVAELAKLTSLSKILVSPDNNAGDTSLTNSSSETHSIPIGIYSLTTLTSLVLSKIRLTGTLSAQIGRLQNLNLLGLGGNDLNGTIPLELTQLTKLTGLDISGNQFTGPIPHEITRLDDLTPASIAVQTGGGSFNSGLKLGGNVFSLLCDCALLSWYPEWVGTFVQDITATNECSSANSYEGINPVLLSSLSGAPCKNAYLEGQNHSVLARSITIHWDYPDPNELLESADRIHRLLIGAIRE